jgi:hypothetical protein
MEPTLPEPTSVESNVPRQEFAGHSHAQYSVESRPNTAAELSHESGAVNPVASTSTGALNPVNNAQSVINDVNNTTSNATDDAGLLIADDVDVIEKEWIDKAKKIVNATREDPHAQEHEVSRLQADYLMKRYNKQIKLSE